MPWQLLDTIPFEPEQNALLRALRIKPGSDDASTLTTMAAQAQAIARPKAVYNVSPVEPTSKDSVAIDGVTLTSRILRVNLDDVHRVFVYVATCGTELEQWAAGVEGLLERYWADALMEHALHVALDTLKNHVDMCYSPGQLSMMNPGSLEDWPLSEQQPLFDVLGDGPATIGVHLTDSFLMRPTKSVSGIWFDSEADFESCQLCPIEDCPNRRAPYDPSLFQQKYDQGA